MGPIERTAEDVRAPRSADQLLCATTRTPAASAAVTTKSQSAAASPTTIEPNPRKTGFSPSAKNASRRWSNAPPPGSAAARRAPTTVTWSPASAGRRKRLGDLPRVGSEERSASSSSPRRRRRDQEETRPRGPRPHAREGHAKVVEQRRARVRSQRREPQHVLAPRRRVEALPLELVDDRVRGVVLRRADLRARRRFSAGPRAPRRRRDLFPSPAASPRLVSEPRGVAATRVAACVPPPGRGRASRRQLRRRANLRRRAGKPSSASTAAGTPPTKGSGAPRRSGHGRT